MPDYSLKWTVRSSAIQKGDNGVNVTAHPSKGGTAGTKNLSTSNLPGNF